MTPFFKSDDNNFALFQGDSIKVLDELKPKFDMVFADPPYFLSNDGLTIKNGKLASVNKGNWDSSPGIHQINEFNLKWLSAVREKMKDDATIWISGTMHNIFSIGQMLSILNFKILNVITWQKTNPPPSWAKRTFTYSTEQIIWARKKEKVPHYYNYELMHKINGGTQMRDVWLLSAIQKWEKNCGQHPTQKAMSVLTRIILASTKPNDWILDPFTGASTTGIAANLLGRKFVGIDLEKEYLEISKNRKIEIENESLQKQFINKINGFEKTQPLSAILQNETQLSDFDNFDLHN